MLAVCQAVLLIFLVPAMALAQEEVPYLLNSQNYGTRADSYTLSYCVDPRDPAWKVDQQIGDAIASVLLIEPKPKIIQDRQVQEDLENVYLHLRADCDLYFGFKLLADTYPGWLTITRPYYEVGYVMVTKNTAWNQLSDIPRDVPLGPTLGTSADFRLTQYLNSLPADQRWPRFPMSSDVAALQAVVDGRVGAAVVWAPSFSAAANDNPDFAGLRVISSSPLPDATIPVGAVLLNTSTFLRANVDQAIQSLVADGTIRKIIDANHFPAKLPQ
jgi:polar amino acid transport system substrate-binding protein